MKEQSYLKCYSLSLSLRLSLCLIVGLYFCFQSFAGLCGALLIVCGAIGAGVFGAIVDKTKRFEEVAKACYVIGLFGGIIFTEVCFH